MTDPAPAMHGCTIDGQPAMPILISEHNALVARAAEAEAALDRAREVEEYWRSYFLISGNAGASHALAMVRAALDGPGPAATQATEPAISPHPAEALLARLVNAPDAAEHCHTVPPNWDGGGPCEYCTALEEARTLLKEQP